MARLRSRARVDALRESRRDVLGPDLFGRHRPPPTPPFLAGHDYSHLAPARTLRLFALLNLLEPTPTHEQMNPDAWSAEGGDDQRVALPPPNRPRTGWSPRTDAEPLPASIHAGIPKIWFTIWTGWGPNRVLRPSGKSALFWAEWTQSTKAHPDLTFIHLTEATRAEIHHALTQPHPPAVADTDPDTDPDTTPHTADVWHLAHWARTRRITLINTDELLSTDDTGWVAHTLRARRARRDGPSLAEFSDLLRLWLVHRHGGLYQDGNKPLLSQTAFTDVAAGAPGIGTVPEGNAAFLAFPRHPLLRAMLDRVRENYRKDQIQLAHDGISYQGVDLHARSVEPAIRRPVIERTGPGMARRVILEAGWCDPPDPAHTPIFPIPHHHPSEAAWLSEDVGPRRAQAPEEIHDTVADLTNRLITDLDDTRGHLDLIAVEPVLAGLPDPRRALTAILTYLATREELRTRVHGAFTHHWKHDKHTQEYTLTPFAYQDVADRHLHRLPGLPPLIGDTDGTWLLHKRATRAILLAPGSTAPTPEELTAAAAHTRLDTFGLHRLPDDPWPPEHLTRALDHITRRLPPEDVRKAHVILLFVAGASRAVLTTQFYPATALRDRRRETAAVLGLTDYDPREPFPLPGPELRVLVVNDLVEVVNQNGGQVTDTVKAAVITAVAQVLREESAPALAGLQA